MKTISAWQGDTISLAVDAPDATADTVTILVGTVGEPAVFSKTASFTDEVADLTITDEENNIPVGTYSYLLEVNYSDGSVMTFPALDDCEEEDIPQFIINERIAETS